jgi:hypothetical protein
MKVLVVDVGGTHVKILASGHKEHRKFPSGPTLTPKQMVAGANRLAGDWKYDVVSIGYPGPVLRGRPVAEPFNLGRGWVGFDFDAAFKVVVGGGNVKNLKELPPGCQAGANANAFLGGFRLWEQPGDRKCSNPAKAHLR